MKPFPPIAAVSLALAGVTCAAQSPAQFVKHADAVRPTLASGSEVMQLPTGKWFKHTYNAIEVTVDVTRTASVLTPILAQVKIDASDRSSQHLDSEAEALAIDLDPMTPADPLDYGDRIRRNRYKCEYQYAPTLTGWTYHSGKCFSRRMPAGFSIPTDEVLGEGAEKRRSIYHRAARAFLVP